MTGWSRGELGEERRRRGNGEGEGAEAAEGQLGRGGEQRSWAGGAEEMGRGLGLVAFAQKSEQ